VPRHRLSSYGRRAFSVAGPAIWNWLVTGQSERSGHQQRLLQAFTEGVFIFSLLVYIAHYSFLDDALYRFTYLLIYLLTYLLTKFVSLC